MSGVSGLSGRNENTAASEPATSVVVCCPKCGGQKHVTKPPYVGGDQTSWVSNNTSGFTCPLCNGKGVIYA